MQSQFVDSQAIEIQSAMCNLEPSFMESDNLVVEADSTIEPTRFHTRFEDSMELYTDVHTVAKYLDTHQGWFCRCAHPMAAEPLGENGYSLVIGRFGAFGYEVEPKIGLELLPQDRGVYRIQTIPIPDYVAPGYEVDYKAVMELVEVPTDGLTITRVQWQLDLAVYLRFPKFIYKLPKSAIQNTGDRLLAQIVRQVSRRLTHKVQEDFHTTLGLPLPKKARKKG